MHRKAKFVVRVVEGNIHHPDWLITQNGIVKSGSGKEKFCRAGDLVNTGFCAYIEQADRRFSLFNASVMVKFVARKRRAG